MQKNNSKSSNCSNDIYFFLLFQISDEFSRFLNCGYEDVWPESETTANILIVDFVTSNIMGDKGFNMTYKRKESKITN